MTLVPPMPALHQSPVQGNLKSCFYSKVLDVTKKLWFENLGEDEEEWYAAYVGVGMTFYK